MIDTRFPTALQIMLTLANAELQGTPMLTSSQMAHGLGSTASLVRRLLVPLGRDGLVRASMGKAGGVRLARPARDIRLSEIYRSATGNKPLLAARLDVPHLCDVSSNVEAYFTALADEAEDAVVRFLGERTLEGTLAEVLALKKPKPSRFKPLQAKRPAARRRTSANRGAR